MDLDMNVDVDVDVDATSCYDNNNATTNARCAKMKIMLQSSMLSALGVQEAVAWQLLITDQGGLINFVD